MLKRKNENIKDYGVPKESNEYIINAPCGIYRDDVYYLSCAAWNMQVNNLYQFEQNKLIGNETCDMWGWYCPWKNADK